jgi:hypothetical protein
VAEPKNPALPKLRERPMFRNAGKQRKAMQDGRAPPPISELIMALVPGGPSEKLAWLRQECAAGRFDGDDPDEIAQAEALLAMLVRMSGSKGGKEKRHLDELLDEGLRETFPASDPVSMGHFTSTEAPSRSSDEEATAAPTARTRRGRAAKACPARGTSFVSRDDGY